MEGRGKGGNGSFPDGEDEVSPWKHNRGCGGESSSARRGKKRSMRHTRVIVTHYGGPDALRVVEQERRNNIHANAPGSKIILVRGPQDVVPAIERVLGKTPPS